MKKIAKNLQLSFTLLITTLFFLGCEVEDDGVKELKIISEGIYPLSFADKTEYCASINFTSTADDAYDSEVPLDNLEFNFSLFKGLKADADNLIDGSKGTQNFGKITNDDSVTIFIPYPSSRPFYEESDRFYLRLDFTALWPDDFADPQDKRFFLGHNTCDYVRTPNQSEGCTNSNDSYSNTNRRLQEGLCGFHYEFHLISI